MHVDRRRRPRAPSGSSSRSGSTRASTTAVRPAVERRLERRLEVVLVVDHEAGAAERVGELGVVGHLLRQVRLGVALRVEELLPLAHHPEPAVVDDHDHDRQPLERRGRELLAGHLEAAVAVDADDRRVGPRRLRADRGRHAVAHRPEPARGDERARPVADGGTASPTSGAGRRRSSRSRRRGSAVDVAQRLEHGLRLEHALGAAVLVRVELAPLLELRVPGGALDRAGRPRAPSTSRVSCASASLSGPTTGISAWRIFPTSAASMSKWITFAPGANAETLPVTRSSKRVPTAMIRSDLLSAQLPYFEPCMPGAP